MTDDDKVTIPTADGGELVLGWGEEPYESFLKKNGFFQQLQIGDNPERSYCTLTLYVRRGKECIIDIETAIGFTSVATKTLVEGLDLCARWAPMVTASALAHWTDEVRYFMLNDMPLADEIEQARQDGRRLRAELAAKRRAEQSKTTPAG